MKNTVLFSMIIVQVLFIRTHFVNAECTGGVVAGIASADGRPVAWKNRDYDIAYQGLVFVSSTKYNFIGIGNSGSRNSRWRYVTIDGVTITAAKRVGVYKPLMLVINQLHGAAGFTVKVQKGSDYVLAVYTVKGQQLLLHRGTAGNTGSDEVWWYYATTPYPTGNTICVAKLIQGGVQSVKKFVITK